jgi:hypothetical protein
MKIKITLIFFLVLSLNVLGQELRILNTQNLTLISEKFGIDSALRLTDGFPIYFIDIQTANELAKKTLYSNPSFLIEHFLIDYAFYVEDERLPILLYDYFNKKRTEIIDYEPDYNGDLPRISEDALFTLIENPTTNTDSLLIWYYNDWVEKSKVYLPNYVKGKSNPDKKEKYKLMSPYEDCNYNCYVILLALKSMNNKFYSPEKLEFHQKNLKYYWQDGFSFQKSSRTTNYKSKTLDKSIILNNHYSNIGSIDFDNEPELKKILNRYNENYCWKFIIYNKNIGYMDLGCQSDPEAGMGELLRIELKGNVLKIFLLEIWVS